MNLSNEVNSPDVLFLQELRVALAVILGGLTPGLFVVFVHFDILNVLEVNGILGIEAARYALLKEIKNVNTGKELHL